MTVSLRNPKYEKIVIDMPLSIDAVVAISRGISAVWPKSVILTEHNYGPSKMVIELCGPKVQPKDDWDDDDDL